MENYLTQITNYLLAQSWQIAVLVVVIAAASGLLKNKSAHIRYLLWLIVLAKCIVPPLLTIPLAILPQEKRPEPTLISNVEVPVANVEMKDTVTSEPLALPSLPVTSPTIMERLARVTTRQWLGFSWIVGVAAFLLFAVIKALLTNFWLWRQRKPLPAELQVGIEDLFSGLEFRTLPKVWLLSDIGQPFVWGLLRGSIYLPVDFIKIDSDKHRRSVLGHEFSHILRFDAAVNILQIMAQAIFWFHPFVWWANKKIRAEREKCCDEMAIARLGAKVRDYSIAIVNTLVVEHESTRPVPSLAVAGPVKNIEERIKTIMKPGKKFYKRPSLVAATVVTLIALLTVPTALVLTARAEAKAATASGYKPTKTLHQATAEGDIERMKLLISKGADINAKNERGRTPLTVASKLGRADVAKVLIAAGADVNAESWGGWTPLHMAAYLGWRNVTDLLIAKGADVNTRTTDGAAPLHLIAIWGGHTQQTQVAELLISSGADVNAKAADGETPLHQLVWFGRNDLVSLLIANGADVNAKDNQGETPLDIAVVSMRTSADLVELLIAKGSKASTLHSASYVGDSAKLKRLIEGAADVNGKDSRGWQPLHAATAGGHKETVELLIARGADVNAKDDEWGCTPLHRAALAGHKDVAALLLTNGAEVDVKNPKPPTSYGTRFGGPEGTEAPFQTPLHWASIQGHRDVAELLLARGANVNATDDENWTPLHYATRNNHKDVVGLLLAKGADVSARTKNGETALDVVTHMGASPVIVELLIAKGAKISNLHTAAFMGDLAKVKSLIQDGEDINGKNSQGGSPLGHAAGKGHKDVVELLIAAGADINTKGNKGYTALHVAAARGHTEIVELLIAKGANINATSGIGHTPLTFAAKAGQKEMVELLRKHGAEE